jgi:hypothetical protein
MWFDALWFLTVSSMPLHLANISDIQVTGMTWGAL